MQVEVIGCTGNGERYRVAMCDVNHMPSVAGHV